MQKSRGKELAVNTIIIGIGKFSTQIISFLLLPLYTTVLSTEEYGTFDLIITISTFVLPLITLLMEESMFRFLIDCKTEDDKKTVISQTVIYCTISSIIFFLIAIVVGKVFNVKYMIIGSIYVFTCVISAIRNSLVRGLGKIKTYTLINFASSVIDIILKIIFIAVLKIGIYGLLLSAIIGSNIASLIVFFSFKVYKYVSMENCNKDKMKEMIKYSIPLVPNSLSWTIINLSDRLVISHEMGTSANGIYSMAYKFPTLMDTIYGFFYTSWKESSAKAINDNDKHEFFNKIFRLLSKMMFSISIGIIACMPLVFNIFIKEAYREAYMYIPILIIATYYNNMSGYFGGIFSAYKDTKIMGTTTIIAAVVNLVVNILLIKFIGIYAAAISTLISCMVVYYYRKIKVSKYIKLENPNMIVGGILLILSLFAYYLNDRVIIKLINFVIIGIYAIINNKEIIIMLTKQLKLKTNVKNIKTEG